MDLFNDMRGLVAEFFEIEPENIERDTVLAEIGLDSFNVLELILLLESSYGITVPEENYSEVFSRIQTMEDVMQFVTSLRTVN